jgi:hypothetical protein
MYRWINMSIWEILVSTTAVGSAYFASTSKIKGTASF